MELNVYQGHAVLKFSLSTYIAQTLQIKCSSTRIGSSKNDPIFLQSLSNIVEHCLIKGDCANLHIANNQGKQDKPHN